MASSVFPVSKTFSTNLLVLKMRYMLSVVSLRFVKSIRFPASQGVPPVQEDRGNYLKTVLTMDRSGLGSYEGIDVVNVIVWLLE